ncbi:Piso0_000882 [Millerozyma farinosa CBS 7064]|uniref:Piso0_000882 protein n=1 Tax=Pichia sorbitophila (strain ATCC MYA-4447 / BCRC 22081 / CBS 7064 / NBRC 10061 / NRRL Y-12695) TaxID=559304 RepID=G8YQB5_PICSO|nr:Piso0_000882 [Millerozyma farinosa CBS 7064]
MLYLSLLLLLITRLCHPLEVSHSHKEFQQNILYGAYADLRNEIPSFQFYSDIDFNKLKSFGIVKVLETNSVIISQSVLNDSLNPDYRPSLNTKLKKDIKQSKLESRNDFVEFRFNESKTNTAMIDWTPIGQCHSNKKSSTTTTFSKQWSISAGSGFNGQVTFASIFGFEPSIKLDLTFQAAVGGTLSCNVGAGKLLQVQAKVKETTIENVKRRKLRIRKSFMSQKVILSGETVWEDSDTTVINKDSVETACVTDPDHLNCETTSSL